MSRTGKISRKTAETDIALELCLEGGEREISTGIGFFDHMLTALAVHGGLGLRVRVQGDLEVDCHHTVEDVGIVLGQALGQALGDKGGIRRYGHAFIPMDEALAECALDISGRPFLVFRGEFPQERCGGFDCCMAEEFFRALAVHAGLTLHLDCRYGKNSHHMIEALFKAFAHALRDGAEPSGQGALSSKGAL
ncbi:imidazoleglycerol-phosphate dehydratase HisB [Acutalibacter sp. 1XD8-33]|uniref:imidazoleglycerol-phosphate dehydratase HisB n=1 Tax=Acutalibacter sp. 1XD8-33 TaxID=2320081 RepID=UPI000EA244C6|nr:imidazoleglycerol-phosphate dehydratase HisB [Acutalibacter sp. 1XD8-33]RKJ40703.1 imidazoleglycerol-phosphate dehydratase HisB [Acutalibacter sp. 1XD8-33]